MKLDIHEKRLVLHAAIVLLSVHSRLKVLGYAKTRNWLANRSNHHTKSRITDLPTICKLVDMATNNSLGRESSCLRRSLVLWYFLKCRGIDSEVRIGFAKDGDELLGHAWVELKGRVINDVETVRLRYVRFI